MALTASPRRRSARRWTWWRPSSERSTPVALLAAHALEAAQAQVVLVGAVLSVGEMGQLQRLQDAVAHEGRAEPGAEAEIEHSSALVAAEGLHGRVVDHPHGLAEGLRVVEAHPARSQVVRLTRGAAVHDGAGI